MDPFCGASGHSEYPAPRTHLGPALTDRCCVLFPFHNLLPAANLQREELFSNSSAAGVTPGEYQKKEWVNRGKKARISANFINIPALAGCITNAGAFQPLQRFAGRAKPLKRFRSDAWPALWIDWFPIQAHGCVISCGFIITKHRGRGFVEKSRPNHLPPRSRRHRRESLPPDPNAAAQWTTRRKGALLKIDFHRFRVIILP